ncbi:unnamed protein product, partial [Polarella glacialis]
ELSGTWLERVTKQLDFYFSDSNLRRDRFMRKTVEEGGGYIDLSELLRFNRIQAMQCRDVSQLAAAIQKSEILELSEDGLKVRRNMTKAPMEDIDPTARTIYVEGLPLTFAVDDLAKFFARHGTVRYIDLPHHLETREPRGFCFVEFASEQEADGAWAEVHGSWPATWPTRYDGKTIRAMPKQRWLEYTKEYKELHLTARGSGRPSAAETVAATEDASQAAPTSLASSASSSSSSAPPAEAVSADGALGVPAAAAATTTTAAAATATTAAAANAASNGPLAKPKDRPGCLVKVSGFPQPQTLLSVRQFAEHVVPVDYCDFPDPNGSCAHLRL